MIRKLIDRLMGKSAPSSRPTSLGRRVEVAASEHGIDPQLLDDHAVRVVRTLKEAGFEAYIVGGAVRDLLVGRRPKDFDVATNATPEQVKGLFRRAFIIGRRFRIVHVVFGRGRDHEVIEVSTFRALLDAQEAQQVQGNERTSRDQLVGQRHAVDASGRILRDNVWGPQVEDAARRDFTINAMYYDPLTQIVVDYHKGLSDLRKQTLRMIGDPATRYREDPVRILRVVRFAAKLGFKVEPKTAKPIRELAPLLANVPASRLFDEMVKLLQTGHALASLQALRTYGLHRGVFAVLDAALPAEEGSPASPSQQEAFIRRALEDTDERVAQGRAVAPSFLLACLLWFEVQQRWASLKSAGEPAFPALQQAIDDVFAQRVGDISGRGKLAADMRDIWMMQPRFDRRTPSAAQALVDQPRFRAGYDFLRLRAEVGELEVELADWWEEFSLASDEDRLVLLQQVRTSPASATSRRRAPATSGHSHPDDPAAAPERKRRRRRRRTAAGAAAAAGEAPQEGGPATRDGGHSPS